MVRIFFLLYLGNRSKSDPCSCELFFLESHILSFPKVLQIPPESPCIYCPSGLQQMGGKVRNCMYEGIGMMVSHQADTTLLPLVKTFYFLSSSFMLVGCSSVPTAALMK